jgi:hypothetical protein
MLAQGNANPEICAKNLLQTVRGEVCFDRTRGLDADLIDRPLNAEAEIIDDVLWTIDTFEPRVDPDTLIEELEQAEGDVTMVTRFELLDEEDGDDE